MIDADAKEPYLLDGRYSVNTLVRCKDCVYYQDNNNGYPHDGCRWRSDETPDADDFCSMAEKMDEDGDEDEDEDPPTYDWRDEQEGYDRWGGTDE